MQREISSSLDSEEEKEEHRVLEETLFTKLRPAEQRPENSEIHSLNSKQHATADEQRRRSSSWSLVEDIVSTQSWIDFAIGCKLIETISWIVLDNFGKRRIVGGPPMLATSLATTGVFWGGLQVEVRAIERRMEWETSPSFGLAELDSDTLHSSQGRVARVPDSFKSRTRSKVSRKEVRFKSPSRFEWTEQPRFLENGRFLQLFKW